MKKPVQFYIVRIRNTYLYLYIDIAWVHCTHLSSSSISLLAVSRAIPGLCWSGNQHFTLAWRTASIQQPRGGVRGEGRCEREPTGPGNPSTPFNSYHYHYHCHPNPTTHSTPAIDIFAPPTRVAVMWSLFFSSSHSVCCMREALLTHGSCGSPS